MGNIFTYAIFTLVPIVMFSTILVLKLRANYLQQIEHLNTINEKFVRNVSRFVEDLESKESAVTFLSQNQEKCKEMLSRVSDILDSLTDAFQHLMDGKKEAEDGILKNLVTGNKLRQDLLLKENLTIQLREENVELKRQLQNLSSQLSNLTAYNQVLERKLGIIKQDMDGLKSNTSRLEGEKKGLEQVLQVKAKLDDDKITKANKVIDLAAKTGLGMISIKDSAHEREEEGSKILETIVKKIAGASGDASKNKSFGLTTVLKGGAMEKTLDDPAMGSDSDLTNMAKRMDPDGLAKLVKELPNLIKS